MARRRSSPLGLELVLSVVLALVVLPLLSHGAPVQDAHADLQQYSEGCYYNYNHYNEGNRILTNEPCLNCTCHNKMLMCYLRVCPFTKPIGHDCTVEKREDQCCPIITCPEVRVDVSHNHQLTTNAPGTELSIPEKYGCNIDSKFYPEGAQLPSNPNKPCELCYCIRNRTSCLMQECTLHIDGCQPIYNKGSCCPVRYNCDHENELLELEDLSTTTTTVRPTPGYILTSTASPVVSTDCVHNNEVYADGASITGKNACEHCYCMRGDIVCAVQECEMPTLESGAKTCRALPPAAGECCPSNYICDDDSALTEAPLIDEIPATTALPTLPGDLLHPSVSQEDVQLQEHIDDKIPATEALETPTQQPIVELEQIPSATDASVSQEDDKQEEEAPSVTTALPIEIATTYKTEDELEETHAVIDEDKEADSTQAPIEADADEKEPEVAKDATTIAPLSEEPQKPAEETNEEDVVSGQEATAAPGSELDLDVTTAAPVQASQPEQPSEAEKESEEEEEVGSEEDLQKPSGEEATTISSVEKSEEEVSTAAGIDLGEAPPKKVDLPEKEEEQEPSVEISEPSDVTTVSSVETSEEEDEEKKSEAEEPIVSSPESPPKTIDGVEEEKEKETSEPSDVTTISSVEKSDEEEDKEKETSGEVSEPFDVTTISSVEKSEEEDEEKKPVEEEPLVTSPPPESPPKKIALPDEEEEKEDSGLPDATTISSIEKSEEEKEEPAAEEPLVPSPESPPKKIDVSETEEEKEPEPSKETSEEQEAVDKIDQDIVQATPAAPVYEMVTQGEDSDVSMPEIGDHKTEISEKEDEDVVSATSAPIPPMSEGEVKDKLPSAAVESTTIPSAGDEVEEEHSIKPEEPELAIRGEDATNTPEESEETSTEVVDEFGSRPPKKESAESSAEEQKPLEEGEEVPAIVQEVTKPEDVPSQTTALPIDESVTESEESEEDGTSSEEESKEKPAAPTETPVESLPAAEVTTISSAEEPLVDSGESTSAEKQPVDLTTVAPSISEEDEEEVKGEPEKTDATTVAPAAVDETAAEEEEVKVDLEKEATTVSPLAAEEAESAEDVNSKPETEAVDVTTVGPVSEDIKKELTTVAPSGEKEEPSVVDVEQGSGETDSEEALEATTTAPEIIKDAEIPSAQDDVTKEKPEEEAIESSTLSAETGKPEAPSSEEDKEQPELEIVDSTTSVTPTSDAELPSVEEEEPKIKPAQEIDESSTIAAAPETPTSEEEKDKTEEEVIDITTAAPSLADAEIPSAEEEEPKIKPEQGLDESSTLAGPVLEPETPTSEEDKDDATADLTTIAPTAADTKLPSVEKEETMIKPEQGLDESSTNAASPEAPSSEEEKESSEEGLTDSTTAAPAVVDAEIPSAEEEPEIKPEQGLDETSTIAAPEAPVSEEDKDKIEEGQIELTTIAPSAADDEITSAEEEEQKLKPEEETGTTAAPAISVEDKDEETKPAVESTTLSASVEVDEDLKAKPEVETVESTSLPADVEPEVEVEDKKEQPQEEIVDATTLAADVETPSAEEEETKIKSEEETSTIAAASPELEGEQKQPQEEAQDVTTVTPAAAAPEVQSEEEEEIEIKPVESSTIAASEESDIAEVEKDKDEEIGAEPEEGSEDSTTVAPSSEEAEDEKDESKQPDATTTLPSLEKEPHEDDVTEIKVVPSEAAKPSEEEEEVQIKEHDASTIAPSVGESEETVTPQEPAVNIQSLAEKTGEEESDKKEDASIDRTTLSSFSVSDEESSEIVEAAEGSGEQSDEIVPAAIPGEGDCLVNDETYTNNASVPTTSDCEVSCKCANSIVVCKRVQCYEPPTPNNCVLDEASTDKCCPQYICGVDSFAEDQRPTTQALPEDEEISFTTLTPAKPYPGVADETVVKLEEPVKSESDEEASGELPSEITTKKSEEDATSVPPKEEVPAPAEGSSTPSSIDIELPTVAPELAMSHVKDEEEKESSAEGSGEEEESAEKKQEEKPYVAPESTTLKAPSEEEGEPEKIVPESTTLKAVEEEKQEPTTVQPAVSDIPAEAEKPKDEVPAGLGVPKIDESIFGTEEPEIEATTVKVAKPETDSEAPSLTSIIGGDASESEEESPEKPASTESGEEAQEAEAPATAAPVEQSTIAAPIEISTIIAELEYQKPAVPEDMSHTKIETELPAVTEVETPVEPVSGEKSEESSTEKVSGPVDTEEPTKKVEVQPDVFPVVEIDKPEMQAPVDQSTEQESAEKDESLPVSPEEEPVSATVAPAAPQEEPISGTVAPAAPQEEPISGTVAPASPEEEPISGTVAPASPEEEPISGTVAPVSEEESDKDVISSPVSKEPVSEDASSEKEEEPAVQTSVPIAPSSEEDESEDEDKVAAPATDKIPETTDKLAEEEQSTPASPQTEADVEVVVSPTSAPSAVDQPPSVSEASEEESEEELSSPTSAPAPEDLSPQVPTTIAPTVEENEIPTSEEKEEQVPATEDKKPIAESPIEKDEQTIDVTTAAAVQSTEGAALVDAEIPESSTIIASEEDEAAAGVPDSPTTIKASVSGDEDLDSTEAPVDSAPSKEQIELDSTEASVKPIDTTESSGEEDVAPITLSTEGSMEKTEDIPAVTEGAIAQDVGAESPEQVPSTDNKEPESLTDKPATDEVTPSKTDRGSEDESEPEQETLTQTPVPEKQPVDESTEEQVAFDEKTEQPSSVPSKEDEVEPSATESPAIVSLDEISPETSKPDSDDQILVDEVTPEIIKDAAIPTVSSIEQEVPATTDKKPAEDESPLAPEKEESSQSTEDASEEDKESSGEKESSTEEAEAQTEKPSILKDEEVVAATGKPETLAGDVQSATDKPISSDESTEVGVDVTAETSGQTEEESSSESEEPEKEKEVTATTHAVEDLAATTVPSVSSESVESETPAPEKEPVSPEEKPEVTESPKEDVKVQTIAEFVTERVEELTSILPVLDVKTEEEEPVTSSEELSSSSSSEEEPEEPAITEKVIPTSSPVELTQAPEIIEEDQKEESPVTESAIAAELPVVPSDDKYNTDLPKPIASSEEETPLLTTLLPLFPQLDLTTAGPPQNASDKIDEQSPAEVPTSGPIYAEPSTTAPTTPAPTTAQSTTPQAVTSAPTSHYQPPSYGHVPPQYPSYTEDEYTDEDETEVFGPGTCRYGGKLFVSAQQIPRDDPCDFCFCFRSDIICLQQSCPPPISGCHEEPISGFCCPRYECPVSMATVLNITTSTTTTSTTLPPHFLHHAYRGAAEKNGCHISGKSYKVGDKIDSASGPCMHCTCGGDGQMKCDPKTCSPEPMLRQMIAVVASRRR